MTAAGGKGIALRCDCADPAEVARFASTLERVDVLVNDISAGDAITEWARRSGSSRSRRGGR